MKLSKRLQAVAEMVTDGSSIADIGTDHAFLPIELVRSGRISFALAMDINKSPLERAIEHISQYGLSDIIKCRLSNGMNKLDKDEVDCAVIAGMGGDLISEIISSDHDKVKEVIVSPHTHPETVRRTLRKYNYKIVSEDFVIDSEKYYPIIKAVKTHSNDISETECPEYDYFGKLLIQDRNSNLKQYLSGEYEKYYLIPQKTDYLQLVASALKEMNRDD